MINIILKNKKVDKMKYTKPKMKSVDKEITYGSLHDPVYCPVA